MGSMNFVLRIIVCLSRTWLTVFFSFLLQNVCVSFPNLANLLEALWSLSAFSINSCECWFRSSGAIVKFAHCKLYKCEIIRVKSYYGYIMNEVNILRSWETGRYIDKWLSASLDGKHELFLTGKNGQLWFRQTLRISIILLTLEVE